MRPGAAAAPATGTTSNTHTHTNKRKHTQTRTRTHLRHALHHPQAAQASDQKNARAREWQRMPPLAVALHLLTAATCSKGLGTKLCSHREAARLHMTCIITSSWAACSTRQELGLHEHTTTSACAHLGVGGMGVANEGVPYWQRRHNHVCSSGASRDRHAHVAKLPKGCLHLCRRGQGQ
jgi:hypothetical protein